MQRSDARASFRRRPRPVAGVATAAERKQVIRAGWNDAAWGRPPRVIDGPLAAAYGVGYAGGLVFRRRTYDKPR